MYLQTCMITACKFARSWPPSAYLQTRSITASKCIPILARLPPPSVSPNSLHHRLQVHLQTRSITASKGISRLDRLRPASSHDHGLQVHISTLARSRPPSASPNSLDYRLQVHLHSRLITASEYISEFTGSSISGAPRIALKHRLQPVQI